MFHLLVSILSGLAALAAGHLDHPSVHGMAVVGEETIYLSHLPMFHSPHDYQAIFEAELDEAGKSAYLASKRSSPETVYTIAPEAFVLPEMVAQPRPFNARIFRGHFERGGEEIASAGVRIKRVVYFQKFHPDDPRMNSAQFILFGKGKERFLAHEISAKPDFDQILSVDLTGKEGDRLVAVRNENSPLSNGRLAFRNLREKGEIAVEVQSLYLEEGDLSF